MKILAIEFSSPLRSVALAEVGEGTFRVLGRAEERLGQSTHAFAMIGAVLEQAGLARSAIDCLAIGLGPGSYAGIRVSLAIAQGWQLATGVRTVGISSIECLAETARAEGVRGPVSFLVDAQRGEFYLADYELGDTGSVERSPLRIAVRAEIEHRLAARSVVMGPDILAAFPAARELNPDAVALSRLAASGPDAVSAGELQPIYLRAVSFVKAPAPSRLY